jgi:hypothetical protein
VREGGLERGGEHLEKERKGRKGRETRRGRAKE